MPKIRADRRRKADFLQRSFFWLALICWGLFLLAILAFNYARPEIEYGLLRYLGIEIRSSWIAQIQEIFLFALWSCFAVTSLSVYLNFFRNRRLEDFHIFYFVLLLIIVVVTLVAYYI